MGGQAMRRFSFLIFLILFGGLFGPARTVFAAALPEFIDTGHQLPGTPTPLPLIRPVFENGAAVVLYGIALVLAGLAVYRFRSRRLLFLLSIASVAVFGFLLGGCPCPIGSLQSVVAAVFLPGFVVPWAVLILFVLPLVFALFYGRVFCSSVCPLGAVQEIAALKPQRIPIWLEHALGTFRYFYLGVAVVFASTGLWFILCRFDPYVSFFRMSGMRTLLFFGGALLLLGVFIARPYCRFLCPYGALLGLCAKLSKRHVSVTPGECTKCRLCEEICPYEAIRRPTLEPTADERKSGPLRLLIILLTAPLLIAFFGWVGYRTAMPVARMHIDVKLAELLRAEETGLVQERGMFRETRAFQKTLNTNQSQYLKAAHVFARVRTATTLLGIWIGLVIVAKLASLAMRRRRLEYEVDPARCVACGRCFWYCPNQKGGRVFLEETGNP